MGKVVKDEFAVKRYEYLTNLVKDVKEEQKKEEYIPPFMLKDKSFNANLEEKQYHMAQEVGGFSLSYYSEKIDKNHMSISAEKDLIYRSSLYRELDYNTFNLYVSLLTDKDIETAKKFVKKASTNISVYGETFVEFCYRHKNFLGIELLIDNGFILNLVPAKTLGKILFIEIIENRLNYIDPLIKGGADVNCTSSTGRTMLGFALATDNAVLGQKLINAGAQISEDSELWYAIMERKFNFAKMLVENGAEIDRYVKYWTKYEAKVSKDGENFKKFLINYIAKKQAENENSDNVQSR